MIAADFDRNAPPMSGTPAVSIVTPTANRGPMLALLLDCVRRQDHTRWEWLVLDDGEAPSEALAGLDDPRIRYEHRAERLPLGEKRNRLVDQARGEVIVQFDDDDFYAPHYVSTMLMMLERSGADIAKLAAFFLYHTRLRRLGYWDLRDPGGHHFVWGSRSVGCAVYDGADDGVRNLMGFGFSYVFRRSLWERTPFPAIDFAEDSGFIEPAVAAGGRCALLDDRIGLCVHLLHGRNSSRSFPQYVLPDFLTEQLFPGFDPEAYRRLAA